MSNYSQSSIKTKLSNAERSSEQDGTEVSSKSYRPCSQGIDQLDAHVLATLVVYIFVQALHGRAEESAVPRHTSHCVSIRPRHPNVERQLWQDNGTAFIGSEEQAASESKAMVPWRKGERHARIAWSSVSTLHPRTPMLRKGIQQQVQLRQPTSTPPSNTRQH